MGGTGLPHQRGRTTSSSKYGITRPRRACSPGGPHAQCERGLLSSRAPIILTGSEDGTVRIWHATTYRLENTLNYSMARLWSSAMCVAAQVLHLEHIPYNLHLGHFGLC